MSLSREIALIAKDEVKFRAAMRVLADKLVSSGPSTRSDFVCVYRPILRNLHRGGWSKEDLRDLQRFANHEYHLAVARSEDCHVIPAAPIANAPQPIKLGSRIRELRERFCVPDTATRALFSQYPNNIVVKQEWRTLLARKEAA